VERTSTATERSSTATPETPFHELTADAVLIEFKAAGLSVIEKIKYTEETEPNNLLGRADQQVDVRTKESRTKNG
jgi:hypothetical protein